MQDDLEAMVARIDERTEHIQTDIIDLKNTCMALTTTVNGHSTQLAGIEEKIKSPNCGLNKRQTAGIGGAAGLFASAIIAIIEYFRH
jgi:hypothetical protein